MLELKLRIVSKCDGIEGVSVWIHDGFIEIERYGGGTDLKSFVIDKEKNIKYRIKAEVSKVNEKEMFEIIESWRVE